MSAVQLEAGLGYKLVNRCGLDEAPSAYERLGSFPQPESGNARRVR
jgi:hypothetical protein